MQTIARLVPQTAPRPRAVAPCPVADLATEAARILSAMKALGHFDMRDEQTEEWEDADFPAVRRLRTVIEGPTSDELMRTLYERLYAIRDLASFKRATSPKGALFQLYIAANHAICITGHVVEGRLDQHDLAELKTIERSCDRTLQSALGVLEPTLAADEDLAVLRRWFFRAEPDALQHVEETIAQAGPAAVKGSKAPARA